MIRTKIVCTIGPAVSKEEQLISLIHAGMNVARINFSHGDQNAHIETIEMLKRIRSKLHVPLGIMIDTKGPEIRTGKVQESGIAVATGQKLRIYRDERMGSQEGISIRPSFVIDYLHVGMHILIDNGYMEAYVTSATGDYVEVEFLNPGTIFSSKSINVPSVAIPLPAITKKDIDDIQVGCERGADMIAASFIRTAEHVLEIKKLLEQYSRQDMLVLAKIESQQGVENFDNILQIADGIMVARGDLGVEIPLAQVPRLQKMMIRKCAIFGKPVITATQMLESMIENPRPTRAEVSDVANAIYDGTSAVMLSGETAIGKYPFETVSIMKSIIEEAEQDCDYKAFFDIHSKMKYHDIPFALTLAGVRAAYSLGAQAIFSCTHSGSTAHLLSRLRPCMQIIALTDQERTYHQLAIAWGVEPVLCKSYSTVEEVFQYASVWGVEHGRVAYGDLVVLTTGSPLWAPGVSNTILVESIGNVLARGDRGIGSRAFGAILLPPLSLDASTPQAITGSILVLTSFNASLAPLVRESAGVILQNGADDIESERALLEFCRHERKTAVVRVENAFKALRQGQLVTLDPEKAMIYKGTVHLSEAM